MYSLKKNETHATRPRHPAYKPGPATPPAPPPGLASLLRAGPAVASRLTAHQCTLSSSWLICSALKPLYLGSSECGLL